MKLMKTITASIVLLASGTVAAHAESGPIAQADGMKGEWKSISCEARPNPSKEPGGAPTPSYLQRHFEFSGSEFTGELIRYADAVCEEPIFTLSFDGQMVSEGPSEAGNGIEKINYILDRDFRVEPHNDNFAAALNKADNCGAEEWKTDQVQSILEIGCPMMRQSPGQVHRTYDINLVIGDMLFFGARHVDGSDFSTPELRPVQLQVPLKRVN